MSLNQITYLGPGDTINETLNLKANSIQVKGNINVPFINGMPYVGGAVNVGDPRDLLQTNAAGTSPEWTNDIKVNDIEVDNDIILDGSSGLVNQTIVKTPSGLEWSNPIIPLSSIPPGLNDSVLVTDSLGNVTWTREVVVDDIEIDDQIKFLSNPGVDGQAIIKSGGFPTWGTPTITIPSIPHGTARQLLQTNAAGNQVEWTSDVQINGNLSFTSGSGSNGNVPIKVGANQIWGKVQTNGIAPGPIGTLLTTDGVNTNWSNSFITINSPGFAGDMKLNNVSGVNGQYIKKVGSSQNWSNIVASDIAFGAANQALLTNNSATASGWGYITENNIKPLTPNANKVLKSNGAGTDCIFDLVNPINISPGTAGQVLVTNGSNVQWQNPVSPIVPGPAYSILQTDSTGTTEQWTDTIHPTNILFNTGFGTPLSNYYDSTYTNTALFLRSTVTGVSYNIGVIPLEYVVIGDIVNLVIPSFSVPNPIGLPTSVAYYMNITLSLPLATPKAVVAPSNTKQTSIDYHYTTYDGSMETGIAGIYRSYYGGSAVLELAGQIQKNYDPNGVAGHGAGVVYVNGAPQYYVKLESPITITYIRE